MKSELLLGLVSLAFVSATAVRAATLSYAPLIEGSTASALTVSVNSPDQSTGTVGANGAFTPPARSAFTWNWGDGTTTTSYFPATHTYATRSGAYVLTVTATDTSGNQYQASAVVRFSASTLAAVAFPPDLAVTLATTQPVLTSTNGYAPPSGGGPVTPSSLYPRATFEQVLSAAAVVENDLVQGDVFKYDGTFRQVMVGLDGSGGAFSIWYTSPVAFFAYSTFFSGTPGWSSLFHEMGHNFTLNMPASYRFGGRTDGQGSALYSETMAQVFQHVAAYELVNHASEYGIPDDIAVEIRDSANQSFQVLQRYALQLSSGAKPFAAWDDPTTPTDETLQTFMCIAYEFFRQSQHDGSDYVQNTKRLCAFLRHFNSAWHDAWDQNHDTAAATSFRSTLMITAMSYAVGKDLRPTFKGYGFAVDDSRYSALMTEVGATVAPSIATQPVDQSVSTGSSMSMTITASGTGTMSYQWLKDGAPIAGATNATYSVSSASLTDAGTYSVIVTSAGGSVRSIGAILTVTQGPTAWIANLSVRTTMAVGQTLFVGCAATGGNDSILVRAVGPGLATSFPQFFSSGSVMADPRTTLYVNSSSSAALSNDDWDPALAPTIASVGAFPLQPNSRDSAFVRAIHDGGNSVTVQGTGAGTVLVELYGIANTVAPRLTNVSARNLVGIGNDVLIAGFVIGGSGTKRILVRAIGPSLRAFGVTQPLADPKLEIYNSANNSTPIAVNDNWDSSLKSTFDSVGAFALTSGTLDSATVVTVTAGSAYSAIVRGADGGTGEALVEVYELP